MSYIECSAKDFPALCRALGYKKRMVSINASGRVTFMDLNWSGGSRYQYTAFDIASMKPIGNMSRYNMAAPWDNPAEGQTVDIPEGVLIACTGYFCGKPSQMTIYCNPANMPALLPAS